MDKERIKEIIAEEFPTLSDYEIDNIVGEAIADEEESDEV